VLQRKLRILQRGLADTRKTGISLCFSALAGSSSHRMKAPASLLLAALLVTASAQQPPTLKRVPPAGVEVPAADRAEIEAGLKQLAAELAKLKAQPTLAGEVPNVEIFHKSADWALRYNEIFDAKQIPIAKEHVQQGLARAAALAKGEKPWNKATGLVVRSYRSKIDGSVQPYGLLIPEGLKPGAKVPLHFWCHGRNEKLSELAFIDGSQKNKGEFTPEGSIVCFLYGRYCNANKFAGEVDLFEALDDIKKHYAIDEQRLVMRGFSMGGAAAWQFGTHHSGMWAAVAPGAGFAETAEFHKVFAEGKEAPPWWEQVLWRWYDCTTMAANLANTTTVAYSGEIDGQKQAADIMLRYAEKEGITFPQIIGPQTAHKYHPDSKVEINKLVDASVAKGREAFPKKVRFTTYSLVYPRTETVWVQGLEKSWERADVNYDITDAGSLTATTKNISDFLLTFRDDQKPAVRVVTVDGQKVSESDGCTVLALRKVNGKWVRLSGLSDQDQKRSLTGKRAGFCGPVDHAFMSKFVFVRPTGKALNETVGTWSKSEMDRAIAQWRQVFRGDVTVVDDTAVSDAIANDANVVAWGDISSNKYLTKIADKLPLKWTAQTLEMRGQKVDAANHAPILIYPNPLTPSRYIVLNSGPTFREAAALNNSDQTPKLPDWAVVDLRTPPGPKWPGQIVDAGFFDENWK
jgi:dienelactone hydrolase